MSWIWGVLIALVLFFYVVAPCIVYFTLRQPKRMSFEPFPPEALAEMPQEAATFFSGATEGLEQLGFHAVLHTLCTSPQRVVVALFLNRRSNDAALVSGVWATESGIRALYVEYHTEFSDGYRIDTSNAQSPPSFPVPQNAVQQRFPSLTNMSELYRLHLAACERYGQPTKARLPEDSEATEFLHQSLERELHAATESGYMQRDVSADFYKPTLCGAFVMTWKQLPPYAQIRKTLDSRQASRMRNELLGTSRGVSTDS